MSPCLTQTQQKEKLISLVRQKYTRFIVLKDTGGILYFYMAAVAIIGSKMFCQKKAFTQECLWAQPASILEVDVPSLNLCGQCSIAKSLFDAPI